MNTGAKWLPVVGALLLICLSVSSYAATVYYVSPTGSDSNNGLSEATAWASIDKADHDGTLVPGDTVMVKAGTYSVTKVNIWNKSGTPGSPITYQAYDGEVIISAPATTEYAWEIWSVHDVVLDGFHLTGAQGGFKSVATHEIEVKNCKVTELQAPLRHEVLLADGSGGWLFHNNILNSASDHAIFISRTGADNKFYNNTFKLLSVQWAFVLCDDVYPGVDYQNTGMEIKNNIMWSPEGHAIYQTVAYEFAHENNLYWSNSGAGWQWAGVTADPTEEFANPKFVQTGIGDFRLSTISPAIDFGVDVGLPYEGDAPDAGAIEGNYAQFIGNTYYVATTGSDSNNGLTEATAWASIDKADHDGLVAPGDNIKVKAGTYPVTKVSLWRTSGQPGAPITYSTYDGDVVVSAPSSTEYAWEMWAVRDVVLDGFQLSGAQGGLLSVGADDIELRNCKVAGLQAPLRHEVYLADGSSGWFVHNNVFNSASDHAVFISRTGANNKFYNNTFRLLSMQWAFVLCDDVYDGVDWSNTGMEIKNNIIWSPEGHVIYQPVYYQLTHQNNICWSNTGAGWQWEGVTPDASERFANPLFVNESAGDFSLAVGSPAIDAGLDVGLPYQGSAPDAGAFESTPVPPQELTSISPAKDLPDGTSIHLTVAKPATVGTDSFVDGFFYIEEQDRSAGIRVTKPAGGPELARDSLVTVEGIISTVEGEKVVSATSVTVSAEQPVSIAPVGMTNKSAATTAPNAEGILARVWGKVTKVADDYSYFYIDDGSNLSDGSGEIGLKVYLGDLMFGFFRMPVVDETVSVVGPLGKDSSLPVVRPRDEFDLSWF